MGISSQNTLMNNFTVKPIVTSITPIYSARLAETHGNFKKTAKFILGEKRQVFVRNNPFE
jgi:hypothetical protein